MSETHVTIQRACGISGFTQQHIERLCSKGIITCVEQKGVRMIEVATLEKYAERKSKLKMPVPQAKKTTVDASEESIVISGIKFVSTNRAARLVGYSEPEVCALANTDKIQKKFFGERLFINLESLFEYRRSAYTHPMSQPLSVTVPKQQEAYTKIVRPPEKSTPYIPARYEPSSEKNFLPDIPEKVQVNRIKIHTEPLYSEKEREEYIERRNRTAHRTVTKNSVFMQQPKAPDVRRSSLRKYIYAGIIAIATIGILFAYMRVTYTSKTAEESSLFGPLLRATTGTIQYYSR